MSESKEVVMRGIIGVVFPAGGITVSVLPTVEAWLRVSSLAVGLTVGLITLIKLFKKKD